jgi:hypothetical protein
VEGGDDGAGQHADLQTEVHMIAGQRQMFSIMVVKLSGKGG